MSDFEVTAADEGRHPPGPEELWGESWYLDWAAPDASYGGYVRLGLYPNLGISWWWIALVGEGRPLVLVVDHALPCPAGDAALAPKTAATTVAISWPDPMERFKVASTATGTVLPDPAAAFHGLEGDRIPVSLDLAWESRGPAFPYAMTTRYEISSWVRGTVTIGDHTFPIDCAGQRDHSWGVRDWWQFPWNWTSGHFDDDTFVHAARSIIPGLDLFATGYAIVPTGELEAFDGTDEIENAVEIDGEKLPTAARQRIGDVPFTTTPVGHAPILLVAPDGRETRFPRAMCRYVTDDGRVGTGWTEYNWPPGFPAET
ncbi:MAG: hypothetical protein FJW88_01745 [Actinobacteria bacterium]|nr:hypothetical protein [Actinomycetota bacterium]